MASLESFLPLIKPSVAACPEAQVLDAIRNACIRFCTDTWLIRETLTGDVTTTADYTLIASTNNECLGVVSFLYNKIELDKTTEEELDILDSGWRTADPGVPTAITAPTPQRVLLNRVPQEAITGGMIVRIATRPVDTATVVEDILFNDWRNAIKYGALEALLEIPKRDWSDIKLSQWYGTRYVNEIQQGRAQSTKGNMKQSTQARNRAWI